MRVIPHRTGQHDLDFLSAGKTADFVVVGNVRVEADVLEMFGDDLGLELAVSETLTGCFVIVEFLDQFGEAEIEEGLAGDLRIVFREEVDPFTVFISQIPVKEGL